MLANMSKPGATPSAAAADGNTNVVGSDIINVDIDSEEIPDILREVWDCKMI